MLLEAYAWVKTLHLGCCLSKRPCAERGCEETQTAALMAFIPFALLLCGGSCTNPSPAYGLEGGEAEMQGFNPDLSSMVEAVMTGDAFITRRQLHLLRTQF